VPAQQGERLGWMEIMQSNKPASTMFYYDVADPVLVSAEHCLPFNTFRFTIRKS
jgi:hypothetical protein